MSTKSELLLEAVADIAYQAGGSEHYSGDSRDDIQSYIRWAREFEKLRLVDKDGNETYNGKEYMSAVEEFTMSKINRGV